MGQVWLEADFLDGAFEERFIEPNAAVASDAPNQSTRHSRQGLEIEDNAIAVFDISVRDLDHAPIA